MNARQLKNSILQRAIEGRLVPQRPEEGTAKELLAAIRAEKARLVAEGKLKKEKPLPAIKAEEISFEIPESWAWVRLGEITSILGDGIHGTPQYDTKGPYYFINGNNLSNGKIIIKSNTKTVSKAKAFRYRLDLNETPCLVSINGAIGNTAFCERLGKA